MVRTGSLVRAYLGFGGMGLACCCFMHHIGTGDPRTPITIEYSLGNPIATVFFASALVSATLGAWLFQRGKAKVEAVLLTSAAICIAILAFTSANSPAHQLALFTALFSVALAPVAYVLRSEFSFGTLGLLAMSLSLTFVVGVAALSPNGPMGLGIAERMWYGCSYFVNAMIIKMLFDEGYLDCSPDHPAKA